MADKKDKAALARKSSQNPDSPFYVDDEEAAKDTGTISVAECIRLARAVDDRSLLPSKCQEYLNENVIVRRALDGVQANVAEAKLIRRWTSRGDNQIAKKKALAKKRREQAEAAKAHG